MTKKILLLAIAALLASCDSPLKTWAPVTQSSDGAYKVTGTLGLALSLGASGKIQFTLGPFGSLAAPDSEESKQDAALLGMAVGQWTLEKGSTKVILPRGSDGYVQARLVYENLAPEVWGVLSSPGCSTLSSYTQKFGSAGDAVVQRTYRLCNVDRAILALRGQG